MSKLLLVSALARKWNYFKISLTASGYEILTARTSAQFWESMMRQRVDAIVLDVSVSDAGLDPWRLIDELSAVDHLLLIVLTRGGRNQDRVRAYQSGAHHCLTMPVTPSELGACLEGILPSGRGHLPRGNVAGNSFYAGPDLQIDFGNRQIRRRDRVYPLTARECPVLQRLVQSAGNMISSQELCEIGWGARAWPGKRNALKTYISQLRRKIERDARRPRYIISQRGMGYAFMPQRIRRLDGASAR